MPVREVDGEVHDGAHPVSVRKSFGTALDGFLEDPAEAVGVEDLTGGEELGEGAAAWRGEYIRIEREEGDGDEVQSGLTGW